MAVRYVLANFLTGAIIVEVPVMQGASWALALNKADALSCTINFADPTVAKLDPLSITEPRKTALFAVTDDDVVLAWGQIDPKRTWDNDKKRLSITASGAWSYWGRCVIGTSALRTSSLVTSDGKPNASLDTTVSNVSLATIGKRLMQARLGWPGATMPFTFPADETSSGRTMTYQAINLKTIGAALTDLVQRVNGPDFDFGARLNTDGLGYTYPVRTGTESNPFLGSWVGTWNMSGTASPIADLQIDDDFSDFAVAVFATSSGQDAKGNQITLASRVLNDSLRIIGGYPPEDYTDTSHSDVNVQATLDAYAGEDAVYASRYQRSFSFTVMSYDQRGKLVAPALGQYRPGDRADLEFLNHPIMGTQVVSARITSVSGDDAGRATKVAAQVVNS